MPRTREALEEFRSNGRIEPYEKEYFRRDGARFWGLFSGGLVGRGNVGVAIVLDISARKRAEAARVENETRHAFLLALSDALRDMHDPADVQGAAARVLGEGLGADRAYYVEVDEARAGFVVEHEWYREDASSHARRYAIEAGGMPWLADERPWVVADVSADPSMSEELRARFRGHDIAALVIVPLVKRGRAVAALAVNQRTPRAWTSAEVALVEEVAQRTWAAVEHARAEVTLRETQRRLDEALATARMAYWHRDVGTGHTIFSPAMAALYGLRDDAPEIPDARDARDALAGDALALLHPDDRERHGALVKGATARGQGWHAEFRIVRPCDGELAWLEEVATVVHDPVSGAAHYTGLVWDVTHRRRAAAAAELERRTAERDELRREMAAVEETERRRLARELHDQLGQQLTAVSLGLEEAARLATRDDSRDGTHADGSHADGETPLLHRLRQLATLARSTMAGARYLALELRPPELDDEGFERALQTYVTEWTTRYGVEAEALVVGETAGSLLPLDVGSALYRVSQEALTNAAKHAGAAMVSVIVERNPGEVRLIIEDDGRGFDPAEVAERARRERRLGLSGIQERAALLGGIARVESSPGNGTTVFVRVPLPGDAPMRPPADVRLTRG
jgi:signal transduction histidine kinase